MRKVSVKSFLITAIIKYPCYGYNTGDEILYTVIAHNEYIAREKFEKSLFNSEAPFADFLSIKETFNLLLPNKWEDVLSKL